MRSPRLAFWLTAGLFFLHPRASAQPSLPPAPLPSPPAPPAPPPPPAPVTDEPAAAAHEGRPAAHAEHHEGAERPPVDWSKVPPVTPVPRAGWFTIRQTGPGYYSLLDLVRGEYREKTPPAPFGTTGSDATPLYDHDFRYLDNPDNTFHLWSDFYKRVFVGDQFLFSSGGEFRYRFNDYSNSQLSGQRDRFDLTRVRAYGDLWYRDRVRAYVELIDARSYNDTLPPGSTDVTGTDLLNAFGEVKLAELGGAPVQLRAGRQEVVLGSQRLVSSPDFANTLRTYDGVRAYWHSPKWDVNLFWVRPVIPNRRKFDSSDDRRALSGLFATHRPDASTLIDLYLLNLNDTRTATRGDTTTFGGRFAGDVKKRLLYDFEAAVQTGDTGGRTINAQAVTAGLGWHFERLPWNVSFWSYFDYASGTQDPAATGQSRTFNQLFPAGHTYFGYIDLVGRQNIQDLNFQLEMNPQPWIQFRTQYHVFRLSATRDALYNSGGTPIRRDPTGRAGREVGEELDLLTNFHLTPRQDLLLGYSRFFAGRFVRATGPGGDSEYVYAQYTFRW